MSTALVTHVEAPTRQRQRREVEHWVWVEEEKWARSVGLAEIQSICRRKWLSTTGRSQVIEVIGELFVPIEREDCRHCSRIYEAVVRRRWARKHGGGR